MKRFLCEERVLRHNKRNCFPFYPDHYLMTRQWLEFSRYFERTSRRSLLVCYFRLPSSYLDSFGFKWSFPVLCSFITWQTVTYGTRTSCTLPMTCLPIIIMASCWASSMRQPPGLHCRTNKRTKRIVNQQGLLSMMTLSESQQDSGKLSTYFTLDSTLTLPGCHSGQPSTDPMRLSHWLLSVNNRAFFRKSCHIIVCVFDYFTQEWNFSNI